MIRDKRFISEVKLFALTELCLDWADSRDDKTEPGQSRTIDGDFSLGETCQTQGA